MDFDESVRIARTPAVVFARLADIQEGAAGPGSPVAAMDKIPPGPTAVGTRWREVIRLGAGRTMTIWSEVTAVEPDVRLAMWFRGGSMRGTLDYTITPDGEAAILRQRESMVAVGWLRPLSGPLGRALRRRLHGRLRELRDELEAVPPGHRWA